MGKVLVIDMETMGKRDSSIILSMGAVCVDPSEEYTFEELLKTKSCYIKFDAAEQAKVYKRTIDKDTMEWWKNQGEDAAHIIKPSSNDMPLARGLVVFEKFLKSHEFDGRKQTTFSRGLIDVRWLESLYDSLSAHHEIKRECPIPFWKPRDCRTVIDILKGTTNGYNMELREEIENGVKFVKHSAIHDAILDYLQLRDAYMNPVV